ncbi:MAG: LysM peptidoglycan-binding domain-containing protein [Verrucomicrobiota bacterium]|nr:MAG: LysM peptidoglycan-binding domain-containing protein [Verrucomicrobiota bacterium]
MEHLSCCFRVIFVIAGLLLGGCTTPFMDRDRGPSPTDTLIRREQKPAWTAPEPLPIRRAFSTPRRPAPEVYVEETAPEVEVIEVIPAGAEYTVEKGDCLFGLAKRFNISFHELLTANKLDEHAQLYVGQRIILPGVDVAEIERTAAKTQTHKVKRNECLSKIAKKYGVSVRAIKSANNLKSDRIFEGQLLVIPGAGYVPTTVPEKKGSKPKEKPFEVDADGYYTLQKNDSLSKVAQKAKVRVRDLQEWNDISDPNKVTKGQKILVRAPRVSATKSVVPAAAPAPVLENTTVPVVEEQSTPLDPYAFMSDADFFNDNDIPIVPVTVKNPPVSN